MKALLASLWSDPKVGIGFLTILASSAGLLLTTAPVSVPVAIGTILLHLTAGGVLLHADSPWKPSRTGDLADTGTPSTPTSPPALPKDTAPIPKPPDTPLPPK